MEQRAYSYEQLSRLKPHILNVCEKVAQENPTAWRQAHNGNFDDDSTRYNDLCVQALRSTQVLVQEDDGSAAYAPGIYAGCNGKRGGSQRSDDVLVFGLTDGRGARDTSGRFPSIAIIDFIGGAGGPNTSVGWNDVSKAAPGRFLDPQGLGGVDGGTPQPRPTPTPTPTPAPAPTLDLEPLRAELEAMRRSQEEMKGRIDAISDALFQADREGSPSMLEHMDDVKRIVLRLPRHPRFA